VTGAREDERRLDVGPIVYEAHLRYRPTHKQRGGWYARTDNSITHSVRLFWHPTYIRTLEIVSSAGSVRIFPLVPLGLTEFLTSGGVHGGYKHAGK
jgi:hypothetical protein